MHIKNSLLISTLMTLLFLLASVSISLNAQAAEPGNTVNEAGVIAARSYDGVWSAPYSGPSGTYITQGTKYDNQQVQIVREAQTSYGTYEQFTVNGNVVGWLDKQAFRTISPITAVSKAGVIQARSYDGIWSEPYASPQGNTWIAMGTNYDKRLVQITGEAQTPYGSYEQFSVDGKMIGWLDSRAFGVIGQISSNNSVNNIGTITARTYDGVWEDPYMGVGTPNIGPGSNYNSWQVQIIREAQTSYGTYEQFSANGKVIGWLDKKAFSSISPINDVSKTGVIQARSYDGIWANPYGGLQDNTWIAMGTNYNNQLVQISREAQTPYGSYEQFSVNGETIGWLDSRAFGVIGQLSSNNTVNNVGTINAASYDGVWSDPYLGPGTPNVGQATSYNGNQVQINREAQTSYGIYEQFSINGQVIGWLDKKAFSSISKTYYNNAVSKGGMIKARSYDGVWTDPYTGESNNLVASGSHYDGQFVTILREAKTIYGTYEQFAINGQTIGWLDVQAFSPIGTMNSIQSVAINGQISAASSDGVWASPYLGPSSPYVGKGTNYNGKQVQIVQEAQTNYGTYEQFSINGQNMGWLDKKAFLSTTVLKKGIDISSYQDTNPIDFNLVSQSGINFVIAKATEGTYYQNNNFSVDISGAKSAGLQTSAYHYFTATTTTTAKSEADYFAAELQKAQFNGYAFADVEEANNCTQAQLTANVNAFFSELQSKGFTKLGIYSNINFLNNNLYLSSIRMSTPGLLVWSAAWGDTSPNSDLWQYSSSGTINGINGNVDLDYSFAYRF